VVDGQAAVAVVAAVVVVAHVAADTTPVAENAATRARTNKEMTIFFMLFTSFLFIQSLRLFVLVMHCGRPHPSIRA
jgi:hypothetical protein